MVFVCARGYPPLSVLLFVIISYIQTPKSALTLTPLITPRVWILLFFLRAVDGAGLAGRRGALYEQRKNELEFIIKTTAHRRGENSTYLSPAGFSLSAPAPTLRKSQALGLGSDQIA